MVRTLTSPALVSSRPLARELADQLPSVLAGEKVVVDLSEAQATAPPFIDELVEVEIVLVERSAATLGIVHVPERTAAYARRSAERRSVAGHLETEAREPRPARAGPAAADPRGRQVDIATEALGSEVRWLVR